MRRRFGPVVTKEMLMKTTSGRME